MRKLENFKKIFVAGHNGMVGRAVLQALKNNGVADNTVIVRLSSELDLRDSSAVEIFFQQEKPDCVIFCAGKAGGIQWNIDEPATFLYDNIMMNVNIVNSAHNAGVKFLLNLCSSCIYPKNAQQPFQEKDILSDTFEPTNEGYAFAKVAGIKMCEMYNKQYNFDCATLIPCNIFGINDKFTGRQSHVIPGLIKRFHDAKTNNDESIAIWGTGNARREFLFSEDVANAIVHFIQNVKSGDVVNIGHGTDYSIRQVVTVIAEVVGYKGKIEWDTTKPEGMQRKISCVEKMNSYNWKPKADFKTAIQQTYDYYLKSVI